jgi:hypothetical protein
LITAAAADSNRKGAGILVGTEIRAATAATTGAALAAVVASITTTAAGHQMDV